MNRLLRHRLNQELRLDILSLSTKISRGTALIRVKLPKYVRWIDEHSQYWCDGCRAFILWPDMVENHRHGDPVRYEKPSLFARLASRLKGKP